MAHPTSTWRRRRTLFAMASVLCLGVLAVCVLQVMEQQKGQDDPSSQPTDIALVSIPIPDLSNVNKDVRKQLQDSQTSLNAIQEKPNVSVEQLGKAFGEMGKLYHAYKLFEAAEACYLNAHALRPDVFKWAYYLGHVYEGKGEPLEAIKAFDTALAVQTDYLPAIIAMARMYLSVDQPDEAEELFNLALTKDPACAPASVGLGKIAAARRDFDAAVRHFESALAHQPEATAIYYPLAMAYRGHGDMNKARELLKKKGQTNPTISDLLMDEVRKMRVGYEQLMLSGVAMGQAGELDTALEKLTNAVQEEPQNPDARVNLGTVLAKLGRTDEAIEQFRTAISLKSDCIMAHSNLGVILFEKGRNEEAIEHFRQAVQSDPESSNAHLGLADALVQTGDHALAANHYSHVIRIDPKHLSARLGQVVALSKAGRHTEAMERLKEGRAVLPESMVLAHAMARMLVACPDQTVRDGRQGLHLAMTVFKVKQSIEHAETVAMAFAEVDQYQQACSWQNQAIDVAQKANVDDIIPRLHQNLALYQAGKPCRDPWPDNAEGTQPK